MLLESTVKVTVLPVNVVLAVVIDCLTKTFNMKLKSYPV